MEILKGYLMVLGVMAILLLINALRKRKMNLMELDMNVEDFKNRKRDFNKISSLFLKDDEYKEGKFFIDDQTWNDLELNKVFKEIDQTLTTPGEQRLYEMIRYTSLKKEDIYSINEKIEVFQNNKKLRSNIRKILALLGKQHLGDTIEILYDENNIKTGSIIVYQILSFAAIVSALSIPVLGIGRGLGILGLVSFVNMIIHYKLSKEIEGKVLAITYLADIAACAKNLTSLKIEKLQDYNDILSSNIKMADNILKNSALIGHVEGLDAIGEYLKAMFLFQVIAYHKIMRDLKGKEKELKELYRTIGEIDALVSISLYREYIGKYSVPKFIEGSGALEVEEALNPLIEKGVENPISIDRNGIILTGTNMSGKSTYLRTIGVNIIMAQSLATTLSSKYKGDLFKVITSISPKDDIENGKSYYMAEVEAVKRILEEVKDDTVPVLSIIDEIFRGTNPIERVAASIEILEYIWKYNSRAIVATHDLDLAFAVKSHYDTYYFSEKVTEKEGLTFDYTIKKGVSNTRNAIKLLRYMGYPNEIVEGAETRTV